MGRIAAGAGIKREFRLDTGWRNCYADDRYRKVYKEGKREKHMKKFIGMIAMTLALLTLLTACGGTFTCDICGEEKSGRQYKEDLFGEEIVYCKDCKEALEEIGNMLG